METPVSEVKVQRWPGGLYTITGGTRTAVKLDRPWQVNIQVDPERCPFCTKTQDVLEDHGDWVVLKNMYTPYPTHRLVVPKVCVPNSGLRLLGGINHLTKALSIVERTVQQTGRPLMFSSAHCGYLGGQNLAHIHHHVLENAFPGFESRDISGEVFRLYSHPEEEPGVLLFEENGLAVVAGGCRVGQCYIIPIDVDKVDFARDFSRVLMKLIMMFNEKFMSKQGLPPDFMYYSRFRDGKFLYGEYISILNNWGSTEYHAIEGEQPFTLPWSHEATAIHLLGR